MYCFFLNLYKKLNLQNYLNQRQFCIVYIVKAFENNERRDLPVDKISEYIRLYGKDLTRLCLSLCKNPADAEDLYQSTWEKVLKNIKKYNNEKPFDKWLFAICVNTHKDMVKSPFRKKILSFSKAEDLELTLNSIPDNIAPKDEFLSLHQALSHLSLEKRQAIALFYFKDYSAKEVAEILNIPEGTVKSRLSSAREQLRKELEYE